MGSIKFIGNKGGPNGGAFSLQNQNSLQVTAGGLEVNNN